MEDAVSKPEWIENETDIPTTGIFKSDLGQIIHPRDTSTQTSELVRLGWAPRYPYLPWSIDHTSDRTQDPHQDHLVIVVVALFLFCVFEPSRSLRFRPPLALTSEV